MVCSRSVLGVSFFKELKAEKDLFISLEIQNWLAQLLKHTPFLQSGLKSHFYLSNNHKYVFFIKIPFILCLLLYVYTKYINTVVSLSFNNWKYVSPNWLVFPCDCLVLFCFGLFFSFTFPKKHCSSFSSFQKVSLVINQFVVNYWIFRVYPLYIY